MAGRITTYYIMRRIHFFASVFVLLFCIMYMATGFIISMPGVFQNGEVKTETKSFSLTIPADTAHPDDFIKKITREFGIRGRTGRLVVKKDSSLAFSVYKPGINWEFRIHPGCDSITIKRIEQQTLARVSSRLHMMRGFWGGMKYFIWSVLYDIAALAFILFALTGIYIWIQNCRVLKTGWLIIVPVAALTLLVYFYLAKC